MPGALSVAARARSSVHFELPPSMIMSPRCSSDASSSTVPCVGSPAGTMIHTMRGASSLLDELRERVRARRAPVVSATRSTVASSRS